MKTQIGSVLVHGASGGGQNGTVMAPLNSLERLIRGDWKEVKITRVSPDESVPLVIREALIGLRVATIFSSAQLNFHFNSNAKVPAGSRFAYAIDVIAALREAGKDKAALALGKICPSKFDLYGFEVDTYKVIKPEEMALVA